MPKRITTCALTLLDKDDLGGITIGVNAKASPGASITEWSVDWDDEETEDNTVPLPTQAKHSYIEGGARLIILSVKDSKGKITSTGLNVLIVRNPTVSVPATPTGLASSLISDNQINLTWTDVATNETGYELQCQIDGGSFFNRTQLPQNTTSYQDLQVSAGHTYTYRVRAFNAGGFSSFSNTTSQTTGSVTYNWYVDWNNGNDSWTGTAPSFTSGTTGPFKTINKAATVATGGQVVGVRNGTYDEIFVENRNFDGRTFTNGGTAGNYITFLNYNGEIPIVKPSAATGSLYGTNFIIYFNDSTSKFIKFNGIKFDGSLQPQSSTFILGTGDGGAPNNWGLPHDINFLNCDIMGQRNSFASGDASPVIGAGAHTIQPGGPLGGLNFISCTIHNGCSYGVYLATWFSIVDNCEIYTCGTAGVHAYNGSGGDLANSNIIRNNTIRNLVQGFNFAGPLNPAMWGIIVQGNNNQIYNNLLYDINGDSIPHAGDSACLYQFGGSGNSWFNNTTTRNSGMFTILCTSSGNTFRGNIGWNNFGTDVSNPGGSTIDHNNWQTNPGSDPLFISGTNFHLTNPGSPCIGQGDSTGAPMTVDKDGLTRTNPWDQGAYKA